MLTGLDHCFVNKEIMMALVISANTGMLLHVPLERKGRNKMCL